MVTNVVMCYGTGIIFTTRVIIVGEVLCCCGLTSVCWVPDHLSWLRLFLSGFIFTPLIITAMSWFCSGLYLLVVTKSGLLAVSPLLLRREFTACALSGAFSISSWVSQLIRDNFSLPYHLVGSLISPPFQLLFPFTFPCPPWPPQTILPRNTLPSNFPPLPSLTPPKGELTWRLRTYLPDNGWVAGKRRDITVDMYVVSVLKLALCLYLHRLTSVFKSLFGQLMSSRSCLTLSSSYRGTL